MHHPAAMIVGEGGGGTMTKRDKEEEEEKVDAGGGGGGGGGGTLQGCRVTSVGSSTWPNVQGRNATDQCCQKTATMYSNYIYVCVFLSSGRRELPSDAVSTAR